MMTGTEQFFDVWKKQAETSVHIVDAVAEAIAKMHSAQLAAANETHERCSALEKSLADAKTAQELWGSQWNWALASCERSAVYWHNLFEAMNEANRGVARCVQEGVKAAAPGKSNGEVPSTGIEAVDNIYREMLKSSQQLLEFTTSVFNAPAAPVAEGKSALKKAA